MLKTNMKNNKFLLLVLFCMSFSSAFSQNKKFEIYLDLAVSDTSLEGNPDLIIALKCINESGEVKWCTGPLWGWCRDYKMDISLLNFQNLVKENIRGKYVFKVDEFNNFKETQIPDSFNHQWAQDSVEFIMNYFCTCKDLKMKHENLKHEIFGFLFTKKILFVRMNWGEDGYTLHFYDKKFGRKIKRLMKKRTKHRTMNEDGSYRYTECDT